MSPPYLSRNGPCSRFQEFPFPLMKKMGFRACGGFRCKQHNRPRREWGFRIAIKGTFLSRKKGDIIKIKVARQRRLACVVFSEREELFQIVPRGLSAILADL